MTEEAHRAFREGKMAEAIDSLKRRMGRLEAGVLGVLTFAAVLYLRSRGFV